jgi:hypothetical protein
VLDHAHHWFEKDLGTLREAVLLGGAGWLRSPLGSSDQLGR